MSFHFIVKCLYFPQNLSLNPIRHIQGLKRGCLCFIAHLPFLCCHRRHTTSTTVLVEEEKKQQHLFWKRAGLKVMNTFILQYWSIQMQTYILKPLSCFPSNTRLMLKPLQRLFWGYHRKLENVHVEYLQIRKCSCRIFEC